MMSERDPQKQLWSDQLNLDKRVRRDQPLRRIKEVLDLKFVRQEAASLGAIELGIRDQTERLCKMPSQGTLHPI